MFSFIDSREFVLSIEIYILEILDALTNRNPFRRFNKYMLDWRIKNEALMNIIKFKHDLCKDFVN